MLPELAGRAHPQARVRRQVAEVLERLRQLRHHRLGVDQVHAAGSGAGPALEANLNTAKAPGQRGDLP